MFSWAILLDPVYGKLVLRGFYYKLPSSCVSGGCDWKFPEEEERAV